MPLYEKSAYLMVEADSLEEAEAAFSDISGTTVGFADVCVAVDDSPAYDSEAA